MKTWIPIVAATLLSLQPLSSCAQSPPRLESVEIEDVTSGAAPIASGRQGTAAGYFNQQDQDQRAEPAIALAAASEEDADAFDLNEPNEVEDAADNEDDERSRLQATLTHLQKLARPLSTIRLTAGVNQTDVPNNFAASLSESESAQLVTSSGFRTVSPRYTVCLMHRPLYYEQANLERCGRGHGLWQNAWSGIQFFSTTLTLPYRMTKNPPDCLDRTLGDCRSCQSFPTTMESLCEFECDRRAFLAEAAALAGFSFLLL